MTWASGNTRRAVAVTGEQPSEGCSWSSLQDDPATPIAHLPTSPGSGRALCGKELNGGPAPEGTDRCVVCEDLEVLDRAPAWSDEREAAFRRLLTLMETDPYWADRLAGHGEADAT